MLNIGPYLLIIDAMIKSSKHKVQMLTVGNLTIQRVRFNAAMLIKASDIRLLLVNQ